MLFPGVPRMLFFTVQQKLTIPGTLHSDYINARINQEEQFASRKTSRTNIINENKVK
jgi:hypothetical protein